jgi:hypothetical protein
VGFRRRNGLLDQAHRLDTTGLVYDAGRRVEEHNHRQHSRGWIVAARKEITDLDLFDDNPSSELLPWIIADLLDGLCGSGNALAQTVAPGGVERSLRHLHNYNRHNDPAIRNMFADRFGNRPLAFRCNHCNLCRAR